MKAVWNSPLVTLYEPLSGEKEPPAPEAILTDYRAPGPNDIGWPTTPGPGFIFGCSSDTTEECLGRGILGLPVHMRTVAASIAPGATIFLFNVTGPSLVWNFLVSSLAILNIDRPHSPRT
jgi:hypothetical protein